MQNSPHGGGKVSQMRCLQYQEVQMKRSTLIAFGLLVLIAAGCSNQQNTPLSPANNNPSENQTPANVQQVLGQYGLMTDDSWPTPMTDPSIMTPDSMDTSFDVYAVTFIWGNFDNTTSPGPATDWSGTLAMNSPGVIAIVNTISFERGQDSLLPE